MRPAERGRSSDPAAAHPVNLQELSGLPGDPDCLHCVLAPVIEKWRKEHPQALDSEQCAQLAQTLGELLGSVLFQARKTECVEQVLIGLHRHALTCARNLIAALEVRGRSS